MTCACGHPADLELYPDKQDKFRGQRRRKLAERPCPDCRQKANAEREARQRAEAAARPRKSKGGPARPVVERLPHGSAFAVSFDAQAVRWSGTLTVPTDEGGKVFQGEASAVFRLLTQLDGKYRQWAAGQRAPAGRLRGDVMKLSRTCGYALLALEYLTARGGGPPAASASIAAARGVPERYLEKALKPLVSAGLLLSVRGPSGGYRLARPAARITLLEVVEAVDGPVRGDTPSVGEGRDGLDARLAAACQEVADLVRKRLREARLSDLVGEGKG